MFKYPVCLMQLTPKLLRFSFELLRQVASGEMKERRDLNFTLARLAECG